MRKKSIRNLVFLEDNITGPVYKSLLNKNVYESTKKLGLSKQFVLMYDNDPKHRSEM